MAGMIWLISKIVKKLREKPSDSSPSLKLPPAKEEPRPGYFRRRDLILLCVALLLPVYFETLDYTVVATAQVHIASAFNRLDLQSWIGTAYLLSSTVFLPLFASIADIWGRHSALQIALLLFMVGSAISTGSNSMVTLLAGRGVAGIGAAGMQALVRIIMSDSKSLDANNWQQSMLFALFALGYCTGPVIGGALLTVSFRWIFAINLPACVIGIILAFLILRKREKGLQGPHGSTSTTPETFVQKLLRVDWPGVVFFMAGGILILLALSSGPIYGWSSTRVIVWFVVGGVTYVLFVIFEYLLQHRTALSPVTARMEPMLPLSVFHSRDICINMAATFVSGMIMLVMFYFVSIFMTIVAGRSATDAGVQLIYFAPGLGAGSLIQISMVRRLRQPKYPIILGSLLIVLSLGLVSLAVDRNNDTMINGFMVMAGAGVGLSLGSLAVHARFSQPAERVAIVSALSLFFRSLGGTIGLAQCGAVMNAKVTDYLESLVRSGALSTSDAGTLSQASSSLSSLQSIDTLPPAVQTFVKDAYRDGTRWAFISLVPWAGLAFVGTLFLSRIQDTDRQPATQEELCMEDMLDPQTVSKLDCSSAAAKDATEPLDV